MSNERQNSGWWNPLHPAAGTWLRGRLGHLAITLGRRGPEWLVSHEYEERVENSSWAEQVADSEEELEGAVRYVFEKSADSLELRPALADRPVIARPRTQVTVPAGTTQPSSSALLSGSSSTLLQAATFSQSFPPSACHTPGSGPPPRKAKSATPLRPLPVCMPKTCRRFPITPSQWWRSGTRANLHCSSIKSSYRSPTCPSTAMPVECMSPSP